MNKVTKDLRKWFPALSEMQVLDVQLRLMYEGIDFSEVSNKELKAEAQAVITVLFGGN